MRDDEKNSVLSCLKTCLHVVLLHSSLPRLTFTCRADHQIRTLPPSLQGTQENHNNHGHGDKLWGELELLPTYYSFDLLIAPDSPDRFLR